MATKDSGFWWIEDERTEKDESYQPLYKYIDAPERRGSDNSSDAGNTDFTVDHTVYQM